MRGVAAMVVVFTHCALLFPWFVPRNPWVRAFEMTPLRLLISGHAAVIIFFVLSGFVLSLPYYSGPVSTRAFLVRRLFRLYPPYAIALLLAMGGAMLFGRQALSGTTAVVAAIWTEPVTVVGALKQLSGILQFDALRYDPPVWSLVYEMRISICFPLLMFAVLRWDWRLVLGAAVAAGIVGGVLTPTSSIAIGSHTLRVPWTLPWTTLEYLFLFVGGAVMARERARLTTWFRDLPGAARIGLWALAAGIFVYWPFVIPGNPLRENGPIDSPERLIPFGLAAAIVVLGVLGSPRVARVLLHPAVHFLGRISYSLYLLHVVVAMVLLHLLLPRGLAPVWVVAVLMPPISVAAAAVFYRLVERPTMELGRRLARAY